MSQDTASLHAALQENPHDVDALAALTTHYQGEGDWRALMEVYDGLGGVEEGRVERDGALIVALDALSTSLGQKKERGAALVALGDVYQRVGKVEEAKAAYQTSFKVWPKDTTCLERARVIYMESKDYERVQLLFGLETKVLKKMGRDDELAVSYLKLARLHGDQLGDRSKALEYVLSARDIAPNLEGVDESFARYSSAEELAAWVTHLIDQAEELASVNPREASDLLVRATRLEVAREGGSIENASIYAEYAADLDAANEEAVVLVQEVDALLRAGSEVTLEEGDLATVGLDEEMAQELEQGLQEETGDLHENSGATQILSPDAGPPIVEPVDEPEVLEVSEGAEAAEAAEAAEVDEQAGSPTRQLDAVDRGEISEPEEAGLVEETGGMSEPVEEGAPEVPEASEPAEASEASEPAEVSEASEASEAAFELVEVSESSEPAEVSEADDAVEVSEADEASEAEEPEQAAASTSAPQGFVARDLGPVEDDALAEALDALKRDATQLDALRVARAGLQERGDFDQLSEVLERSVKYLRRKDGEFEMMAVLAELKWRHFEDLDGAEYYYKRLRHHDGDMPEVLSFYESYYEAKGEWRKLHVHLNSVLGAATDESRKRELTQRMASLAEDQMGSPEKAMEAWRSFLTDQPGDVQARSELRRLYEDHEKWNALIDYLRDEIGGLEETEGTELERAELLREIADIYRDRIPGGDINRINTLNGLLELDPERDDAFDELRLLLEENRRFSELAALLSRQAESSIDRGNVGRGVELLEEVADLWQERLNNVAQALPYLQRIIEVDPDHGPTRARLKDVYAQRRDYPALFELMSSETDSLSGDQQDEHLRELLTIAQDRLRDAERSIPLLEQLIGLNPSEAELYDKLDYFYKREERFADQAALLVRKSELDALGERDRINALREAATLYEDPVGDADEAAELWARVLGIDASNSQAFSHLTELYVRGHRFDDLEVLYAERDQLSRYFDTLDTVAQTSEDPALKRDVYRRMADLAEARLEQTDKVLMSLESLLEHSEDKPAVARELIGWYERTEDVGNQVTMHELLLEHAAGSGERFDEMETLSRLERARDHYGEALRWQLGAVAEAPERADALDRAEELAREVDVLESFIERLHDLAAERDGEVREALWRREARLARDDMEDYARAIALYEQLRGERPDEREYFAALEGLYETAAYPEKRIALLREWHASRREAGASDPELVEHLAKIANVQHTSLGQVDEARATYTELLELDPDYVPAIRGLREIYAAEARWADVVELLEREFELVPVSDAQRRADLRMELSSIARVHMEDHARGLEYLADILNEDPAHEGALDQVESLLLTPAVARDAALLLEPIFRDRAEHDRLAAALEARLVVCDDRYEEQEILEELVRLYVEVLEDREAAFPRAARRFELDASNPQLADELIVLGRELERWAEVEALLTAHAPLGEMAEDPDAIGRVSLLRPIAEHREVFLANREGALEAWERLYDFEPEEIEVIEALERLYGELARHADLVRVRVAKSDVVVDPDERVALLAGAAAMTDEVLADVDGAVSLYERILEIEPTADDAFHSLSSLLSGQERWVDLDTLYGERANLESDPAARRVVLLQQAALRTHKTRDFPGAFGILRDLTGADPGDRDAVEALVTLDETVAAEDDKDTMRLDVAVELEQVYRTREAYPELIGALLNKLDFTEEPFERIILLDELSELYLDRLGDAPSAFKATRLGVLLMPADPPRRERLETLGERLNKLDEVVIAFVEAAEKADPFEAAPIYKRAGQLFEERLSMPEEAVEVYERALDTNDADEEALAALEGLYAKVGSHAKLTDNLRAQAAFADPDRRLALLAQVGQIEEELLERPQESIDAWSELLNSSPDSLPALDALERLYGRQEQWIDLADVLRRRADVVEDDEDRLDTLTKLARTQEERLEDLDEAISTYQRVLLNAPHHLGALDELDRLFRESARGAELSEVLRTKLGLVGELIVESERTSLELRQAKILHEELMSTDESLDLYLGVFAREPGQADALAALEGLARDEAWTERAAPALIEHYTAQGEWDALVSLHSARRDMLHDPIESARVNHLIATIHRDQRGDLPAAFDALSAAWRGDVEEDVYLEELRAVAEVRESFRDLAEVYEAALAEIGDPSRLKTRRVELAELYRDRVGDDVEAEANFSEALNLDELDPALFDALEALFVKQERWQDLIDLLERRYNVFAAQEGAHGYLLQIAHVRNEFLGDGVAAVDDYRRVLDIDPMDPTAAAEIERLYRAQQRWQDLADFFEQRVGQFYDDPARQLDLRLELATVLRARLFEPERALDLYREILAEHEHEPRAVAALESLFAQDEALRDMVAAELEPIYEAQGEWEKLASVLRTKADAESDPYAKAALLERLSRLCEGVLKDYPRALSTWGEVFALQPERREVRASLGHVAERLQAWDALVGIYERVLEESYSLGDEDRATLLMELGAIREERMADLGGARAVFERVLEVDPAHEGAFDALERVHTRASAWQDLSDLYTRRAEVELDPERAVGWLDSLATLREEVLEDLDGAIDAHSRVLDLAPDERTSQRALQRLMAQAGRFEDLGDLYQRLIDQSFDADYQTELRFRLAQLQEAELDRIDDAIELYRVILLDNPAHPESMRALEGVRRDLATREGDWEPQQLLAIESLLEHYDHEASWRKVVELYQAKGDLLDAPDERYELLMEAGRLTEARAHEEAERYEALRLYSSAYSVDPSRADAFLSIESLATAVDGWSRVVPMLMEALEGAEEPTRQARILDAIARVYLEHLGDAESALVAYQQALECDPEDAEATRELEGLYGQFSLWGPLVALLSSKLERTFDGEARVTLLRRIASLNDDVLSDSPAAIAAYEQLRELDPSEVSYLDALARLYADAGRHVDLEDALGQMSNLVQDRDRRLAILRQLATVQDELLENRDGAVDTYRRIAEEDLDDVAPVDALARLYLGLERWYDLVEILGRRREFAGDTDELDAIDHRIAQVRLFKLDQRFDALELFGAVARRSPHHEPSIEALSKLMEDEDTREAAFATLAEVFASSERHADLVLLYETRLGYLSDPHERALSYSALAGVQERDLGVPSAAFETFGRAFTELNSNPEIRAELERLGEENDSHQRLVVIYEAALARGIDDPSMLRDVHARLGELYMDHLEQNGDAIGHLEKVLEIDEYDASALAMLDQLYQVEQRWEELADVLTRQLTIAPPDQINQARFRLGYLRELVFEQHVDAFDLYRQVILDEPTHRPTTEALERLVESEDLRADVVDLLEGAYTQTQAWGKLAQLLGLKLDLVDGPHERADLHRRIADLELDELDRAEAGFHSLGHALAADPFDPDTQARYEALAAEHGLWADLVTRYESILEGIEDQVRVVELALVAATASHTHTGDASRAVTHYMTVLDIEPQNEQALAAMESLARQADDADTLARVLRRKVDLIYDPEARFATLFELGGVLTGLERLDDAIEAFREASLIDDSSIEVANALATLYEATERWPDLIDAYEHMTSLVPDAETQYGLLMRSGQLGVAHLDDAPRCVGFFERALALYPNEPTALRSLEPLYEELGQLEQLAANLELQLEAATETDERVRVLVRRAQIAYQHGGDSERAIGLFQQASALDPTSELITTSLDELYRKEERWEDLFNLYYTQLEATEEPARRADLATEMAAISYEHLGAADTAEQYLQFALQLTPGHARALEVSEGLYRSQERWEDVAGVLGQRIEVSTEDDDRVTSLLERAALFADQIGDPERAAKDYAKVLDIDPAHPTAFESLRALLEKHELHAQLYDALALRAKNVEEPQRKGIFVEMASLAAKMGNLPKQVESLEAAYALDSADLDVVRPLLDAYISAAMFESAEPILVAVIDTLTEKRRMKDVVGFYHLRGKLSLRQGDEAGALESFNAAHKIDATYVPNLMSLGKLTYAQGDNDQALKIFQTLLLHQMKITDPAEKVDMYYHLGQIRLANGDARRAKDMFNRALGVDPEHAPSKEAMAAL